MDNHPSHVWLVRPHDYPDIPLAEDIIGCMTCGGSGPIILGDLLGALHGGLHKDPCLVMQFVTCPGCRSSSLFRPSRARLDQARREESRQRLGGVKE